MSENENVPMIHNNLAIEFDNVGDFQSAMNNFDKAIDLNPGYVDAYVNRGNLKAQRLNNFGGAIQDYLQAIGYMEKDGFLKRNIADYADVYNNMGTAKSRMNDVNGALNDYIKAIQIKPDFAQAYYNRGIMKAEIIRDYEGAMKDLNRSIEIDPEYYDAFVNRGVLREVNLNDPEGALADYSKAISIRPDLALAYFNRGMYFKGRDNYSKACKDWQTATNLGHGGAAQMLRSYCK
jgi:tetratricopeptide (TPR) repeat protein